MPNLARTIFREDDEDDIDPTPMLEKRGEDVLKILECLRNLSKHPQWRAFKTLVLKEQEERVIVQLGNSTGEKTVGLQGELRILRRFLDFDKLIKQYEAELTQIKSNIKSYGTKNDARRK